MKDILDVIVSRRSVKKYKDDMIDKELIDKVIKAGTFAPSGKNMQSSIILAITNKEVRDRLSNELAKLRGDVGFDPFYNALSFCVFLLINQFLLICMMEVVLWKICF